MTSIRCATVWLTMLGLLLSLGVAGAQSALADDDQGRAATATPVSTTRTAAPTSTPRPTAALPSPTATLVALPTATSLPPPPPPTPPPPSSAPLLLPTTAPATATATLAAAPPGPTDTVGPAINALATHTAAPTTPGTPTPPGGGPGTFASTPASGRLTAPTGFSATAAPGDIGTPAAVGTPIVAAPVAGTLTTTVTPTPTPSFTVTPTPSATLTLTPTPTASPTPTATLGPPTVTLQRHLSGPRLDPRDEHSAPARERVEVELTIESSADLANATLSDDFPADWAVVGLNAGALTGEGDRRRVSWRLGAVPALQPVHRSYVLSSPARRSGDYVLHARLEASAHTWVDDWPVRVADSAPTVDPPLHAAHVLLSGVAFDTINAQALGASIQTGSTALDVRRADALFVDSTGISTWVSDPVPTGRQWAFGNPWTFDMFVRANTANSARVLFAARIFRVSGSAAATLLHQTPYSAQVEPLPDAAFQRVTWQDATLPAVTLTAGERIGISLLAFVDSNPQPGLRAILGFDNAATPSTVTWAVVDQAAPVAASTTGGSGAPPTGPTPVPQAPAHNLHVAYGPDTAACAACHRTHTARGGSGGVSEALRKAWPEEQLCYTCHDGTAAPNIKAEFARLGGPVSGSAMPIGQTEFVHRMDEVRVGSTFSGVNRHVECEDCHNPHQAGKGDHQPGTAYTAAPQQGVWGISAAWSAAWTPPAFNVVNQVTYQYQLCFKCHSSWAYGASPPRSPSGGFPETDQSVEFSPLNPAYHPVAAVGKNPFRFSNGTSYAGSLLSGLTPSSNLVCSDCHASQNDSDPAGPHGSTNPFILRGTWDRTTGVNSPNALCFKCHDPNVYANPNNKESPWDQRTGFSGEGKNLHAVMVGQRNKANADAPIVCMDCHVAVPHGWQRDRLIAFTGDGAPYVNRPYSGGLTTIDTWQPSGQWTFDSCGTAMESCK